MIIYWTNQVRSNSGCEVVRLGVSLSVACLRMLLGFPRQGVSPASWGVATSTDGIHFDLVNLSAHSSQSPGAVDGNSLLIDDDGTGYIAYATVNGGGQRKGDHMVTIDILAKDYLSSTLQLAAPIFPDTFVEGVMLFKRSGFYYLIYSSCCCCCSAGAGAVVFRASSVSGPWVRQERDVNCGADVPICAGMASPHPDRPTGHLTIAAQGMNVARLRGPTASSDVFLWIGERWMSGPFAPTNPRCIGDCMPPTGVCARDPRFMKGHEFIYWVPLQFDKHGSVLEFEPFQNNVTLALSQQ
jgi:hypothetical protein